MICALGGDDLISTLDGDDIVRTGSGRDFVEGAQGRLRIEDFEEGVDEVGAAVSALDGDNTQIESGTQSLAERLATRPDRYDLGGPPAVDAPEDETSEQAPLLPYRDENALANRASAGFAPLSREELAHLAPTSTGQRGIREYGAPMTSSELERLDRRSRLATSVQDLEEWASQRGLNDGLYLDADTDQLVVNLSPENRLSSSERPIDSLGVGDVAFRDVPLSISEIDSAVGESIDEIRNEVTDRGGSVTFAFSQSLYMYEAFVDLPGSADASDMQPFIDDLSSYSPHVIARLSNSGNTTGDADCDEDDCYMYMPGMHLSGSAGCTLGLIINYGSAIAALSADHCVSNFVVKVDAPSSAEVPLTQLDGSAYGKEDDGAGVDYRVYAIHETPRAGYSTRNTTNLIMANDGDHSNVLSGYVRTFEGEYVCGTGYVLQRTGTSPSCGTVYTMGDLAPGLFSSGYIGAEGAICEGDSGGPVWAARSGNRYSIGIHAEFSGPYLSGGPYAGETCRTNREFTDTTRVLGDLGATFYNPAGTETSRRAALRYYDILFNREADLGGFDYYDGSCNLTRMRDYAWVFAVTGNTEFENRYPLSGSSASSNAFYRVRRIYQAMLDRIGSYSDVDYWRDYIYGSSTSSTSARESRYDYFAWLVITNPYGTTPEFSVNRMNSTGQSGAPPMCSAGW